MILAIGIYYLMGIVIGIINGIYCGAIYDGKIEDEKIAEMMIQIVNKWAAWASGAWQKYGICGQLIINVLCIAFFPIIVIALGICWIRACDRFVNEKEEMA